MVICLGSPSKRTQTEVRVMQKQPVGAARGAGGERGRCAGCPQPGLLQRSGVLHTGEGASDVKKNGVNSDTE